MNRLWLKYGLKITVTMSSSIRSARFLRRGSRSSHATRVPVEGLALCWSCWERVADFLYDHHVLRWSQSSHMTMRTFRPRGELAAPSPVVVTSEGVSGFWKFSSSVEITQRLDQLAGLRDAGKLIFVNRVPEETHGEPTQVSLPLLSSSPCTFPRGQSLHLRGPECRSQRRRLRD